MEQQGDEYRITNIHIEDAPANSAAPAKDDMTDMEGMDHSQHDMGAKQ